MFGCLVAHHAAVVVADVPSADVIAPDDEDVGFLVRRLRRGGRAEERRANRQQGQAVAHKSQSYFHEESFRYVESIWRTTPLG